MTGTLTPTDRRPPAPPPQRQVRTVTRAPHQSGDGWRSDPTLAGTVAITVVTLSVALGFGRLFAGGSFLVPVILTTLVAHGISWWCRRHDQPTALAAGGTAVAVTLIAAWTLFGHTTAYGVPLAGTLRAALDSLAAAREVFAVVKAPAEVLPGFVLATVVALGFSAALADWTAFRIKATFEAIIPAFTLFLFTAALGTERHRTWAVALFVAAALGFVVVANLSSSARAGAWFGGRSFNGPGTLARNAAVLGLVALVAALAIGPRLPAPDDPLVKYKNRVRGDGPTNRATVSPLVDIRGRLVERSGIEVFTVRSDVPSYWRLTSLDDFDGNMWTSADTYRETGGRVGTDEALRAGIPTSLATQEYSVSALASIWLPVAFRPQQVKGLDSISYNRDTASIITPFETTDGSAYTVKSAVPQLTPELLNSAPPLAPPDLSERYRALPPIAPRVAAEARRIVGSARTPYEKARALQDHFHKGDFRYDLNARPGHDSRALENFLLDTRTGYCEQFAGAYAVLARLVGLPARVAVGFTPGEQIDGVYHVRDEHAHAWPEIYLHGFGWVAFEPTPGRGAPNNTAYTGRPEDQEDTTTVAPGATTTTSGAPAEGDTAPTTTPESAPEEATVDLTAEDSPGLRAIVKVLLAILGVVALWVAVVPALHLRRRRARHASGGAAAAVLAEWLDTTEALATAGVARRATETMSEYAERAATSAGLGGDVALALRRLAAGAATATYSRGQIPAEVLRGATQDGRLVRAAVFEQVPMTARIGWWLDPRPLVTSSR